ncbi:hypothetical protein [Saccharomonospora viridis]|uniref:hypothetical protein n=1 Tax=Saccharomonospora viridis TaxID=1852 RepID=UPI00240A843D|nr:hypothetical protein [Saccharomonospora viridis]
MVYAAGWLGPIGELFEEVVFAAGGIALFGLVLWLISTSGERRDRRMERRLRRIEQRDASRRDD